MRIAVLWSRFGAYHLARLAGLSTVGAGRGAEVLGLEIAARDHYPWDETRGALGFERRTLFPAAEYGSLRSSEIEGAVARALEQWRPDAVAINGWAMPESRAALAWCRRHGATSILMSETKADDAPRRWWREWLKARQVKRHAAAVVGGRAQADYVVALGIDRSRVFLGYDAVDNDYFADGAEAARRSAGQARARLGLPESYFFACTRFIPRKNLRGLLAAYARYRARVAEPWSLVIAGGGEEGPALEAQARADGIEGIHWAGVVQYPDLPACYGLAGAFVHPALAEPWGLVLNEAAASGLPLLVGRTVGAALELVEDGRNGWRFDASDIDDMANTLQLAAALSPERRRAFGEAAQASVARFSTRRFGEAILDAIASARACPAGSSA